MGKESFICSTGVDSREVHILTSVGTIIGFAVVGFIIVVLVVVLLVILRLKRIKDKALAERRDKPNGEIKNTRTNQVPRDSEEGKQEHNAGGTGQNEGGAGESKPITESISEGGGNEGRRILQDGADKGFTIHRITIE